MLFSRRVVSLAGVGVWGGLVCVMGVFRVLCAVKAMKFWFYEHSFNNSRRYCYTFMDTFISYYD